MSRFTNVHEYVDPQPACCYQASYGTCKYQTSWTHPMVWSDDACLEGSTLTDGLCEAFMYSDPPYWYDGQENPIANSPYGYLYDLPQYGGMASGGDGYSPGYWGSGEISVPCHCDPEAHGLNPCTGQWFDPGTGEGEQPQLDFPPWTYGCIDPVSYTHLRAHET